MTSILLGAGFEIGEKIGNIATYALLIISAIVWIWVMFKYLDTSDLNG